MNLKSTIFLTLCISSSISFGQNTDTTQKIATRVDEIEYYIDSIEIPNFIDYFFDPNNIEDVKSTTSIEPNKKLVAKLYLKSKPSIVFNFISLNNVKDIYCKSATHPYIFMIDHSFLKNDLSSFRIDSSYILSVETIKGSEIESVKEDNPNLTIIIITTKNSENLTDSQKIRLRGNQNNF